LIAYLKLGAALAVAGACFASGWKVRDYSAVRADLERERAASVAKARQIERADEASQLTERKLAEARATAAAARVDADRVRDLASRVRASEQASEHDAERIRVLSGLVAESARLLEEGEGVAGRLDARLAGCQASP